MIGKLVLLLLLVLIAMDMYFEYSNSGRSMEAERELGLIKKEKRRKSQKKNVLFLVFLTASNSFCISSRISTILSSSSRAVASIELGDPQDYSKFGLIIDLAIRSMKHKIKE